MQNRVILALKEPLARAGRAAADIFAGQDHPIHPGRMARTALHWANRHRGWLALAAGLLALGWGMRRINRRKRSAQAQLWREAPEARHGLTPARQ